MKFKSNLKLKLVWKKDQNTMMNVITTCNGPMNPNDDKIVNQIEPWLKEMNG